MSEGGRAKSATAPRGAPRRKRSRIRGSSEIGVGERARERDVIGERVWDVNGVQRGAGVGKADGGADPVAMVGAEQEGQEEPPRSEATHPAAGDCRDIPGWGQVCGGEGGSAMSSTAHRGAPANGTTTVAPPRTGATVVLRAVRARTGGVGAGGTGVTREGVVTGATTAIPNVAQITHQVDCGLGHEIPRGAITSGILAVPSALRCYTCKPSKRKKAPTTGSAAAPVGPGARGGEGGANTLLHITRLDVIKVLFLKEYMIIHRAK